VEAGGGGRGDEEAAEMLTGTCMHLRLGFRCPSLRFGHKPINQTLLFESLAG